MYNKKIYLLQGNPINGSLTFNWKFLVSSIVIDSDRGHCYEYLKKNQITMKIEPVTYI